MTDTSHLGSSVRGIAMIGGAVLLIVVFGVFGFTDLPKRFGIVGATVSNTAEKEEEGGHNHTGHNHPHGSDDSHEENSVELSQQARGNLGLQTQIVSTSKYTQYVSIPATIADWPGRTHIAVTAPLTGVVNAIYVSRGELIRSGQPLFNLRLTHQDLVKTQSDFLAALGRMDVEQREIKRLTSITRSGAVAGKNLIEREYEYDRLQAEVRAERQAMLLHGLSEAQIAGIEQRRQLVREVTVYAPTLHGDDSLHHESEATHSIMPPGEVPRVTESQSESQSQSESLTSQAEGASHEHVEAEFLITMLNVNRGQSVNAGESLGRLSDYSTVLIEGHAFQKDGAALRTAAKFKLPIQAVIDSSSDRPEIVDGLGIWYIGSEVGINSRALPFFVILKNEVERSEQRGQQRYVSWKFKPGQRLQLRVPQQGFENTIVVPKDAVAEEGFERYVFVDHGDHLDRRPVRVLARDDLWVAIRNDGSLRIGQSIAVSGAHQLQMEMKNKAGGPVDAHAGHSH